MKHFFMTSSLVLIAAFLATPLRRADAQAAPTSVLTVNTGGQFTGELFRIDQMTSAGLVLTPFQSGNPIVVVDDGLRLVHLNQYNLLDDIGNGPPAPVFFSIKQKVNNGAEGKGILRQYGPFNRFGHREFIFQNNQVRKSVQGITLIHPRYCEVQSLVGNKSMPLKWTMRMSTSTISKDVLISLLENQIDENNPNPYYEIVDFFTQAGDFTEARNRLAKINQLFPDQKERVKDARIDLNQLQGRKILQEVKLRVDSGQSKLGLALAGAFDKSGLANDILAAFDDVANKAKASFKRVDDTRQQLMALIEKTKNVSPRAQAAIDKFKTELESELNQYNEPRLAAYQRLANDDSVPDGRKVALAISGWLTGSNNATEKLADVESMYLVRDLAVEYLKRDTTLGRRTEILTAIANMESGTPQFIDAALKQAKPIDAEDISNYTAAKPIEFMVEMKGTSANQEPREYRCVAHLPPEYNPYKKYPMILTLTDRPQSAERSLGIWAGQHSIALSQKLNLAVRSGHAMRQGFIVVAVDWMDPGQGSYQYSAREHRVVNDALWESFRRFSVNTDRVFLSGHGNGATAAFDIGLSHPEHWAGVLGYSGQFGKYIEIYQENQHSGNLPLYTVNGRKDPNNVSMEKILNRWLKSNRYQDVTAVHYKGRLNENFEEDIPNAFEWMRGRERRWPDKTGFSFKHKTMRHSDSYYWFFELDRIPAKFVVQPALYDKVKSDKKLKFPPPFVMTGSYKRVNDFILGPPARRSNHRATLWLSPEYVDFDKVISIKGKGSFRDFVKPSNKTLLDDVLRRGDVQHPYWARVDYSNGGWENIE